MSSPFEDPFQCSDAAFITKNTPNSNKRYIVNSDKIEVTLPKLLPSWNHNMQHLAGRGKASENYPVEIHRIVRTSQKTFLGALAIIVFAAFFVQLTLIITTFTTAKVYIEHFSGFVYICTNTFFEISKIIQYVCTIAWLIYYIAARVIELLFIVH